MKRVALVGLIAGLVGLPMAMAAQDPAPASSNAPTGHTSTTGSAPTPAAAAAPAALSIDQIRQTIQSYVLQIIKDDEEFTLEDDKGNLRTLELQTVHDAIVQTGDTFSVLADMKDTETSEIVQATFELEVFEGAPEVLDVHLGQAEPQTPPEE